MTTAIELFTDDSYEMNVDGLKYLCKREKITETSAIYNCTSNKDIGYSIVVERPYTSANYWFKVIVNIEPLDAKNAQKAVAIAANIAIKIDDGIRQVLSSTNKNMQKYLEKLSVRFTPTPPFFVIGYNPGASGKEENIGTGSAKMESYEGLVLRLSRFVTLIIKDGVKGAVLV